MKIQEQRKFFIDLESEETTDGVYCSNRIAEVQAQEWEHGLYLSVKIQEKYSCRSTFVAGERTVLHTCIYDKDMDQGDSIALNSLVDCRGPVATRAVMMLLRNTCKRIIEKYAPKDHEFYLKHNMPMADVQGIDNYRVTAFIKKYFKNPEEHNQYLNSKDAEKESYLVPVKESQGTP